MAEIKGFFFKMTEAELESAKKVLASQSEDPAAYNIKHYFDDRLNERAENANDMTSFANVLIAKVRVELAKPAKDCNWTQVATDMGMAGALRKITGPLPEAELLLKSTLQIIRDKSLPTRMHVQNSIRLHDVFKKSGRLDEALEGLNKIVRLCEIDIQAKELLDFAVQHRGKVQFAMGSYQDALSSFERALEIRAVRRDPELIESTKKAIQSCKSKLKDQRRD